MTDVIARRRDNSRRWPLGRIIGVALLILLSPVLAGEKTFEQIVIKDRAWYDDNEIELVSGDPVIAVTSAPALAASSVK